MNTLHLVLGLLEKHRSSAVLLDRPFPPHHKPVGNSHFGGLPNLPPDIPWPRQRTGTPLHFLLNLDCAELPKTQTVLPTQGRLLFFIEHGMMDEWVDYADPGDACRVIFVRDGADALPTAPPDNLPPIGSEYPSDRPGMPGWLLPGEAGPNVHWRWPCVPRTVDSWPSVAALPQVGGGGSYVVQEYGRHEFGHWYWDEEFAVTYSRYADAARANAFLEATGQVARPPRVVDYAREARLLGLHRFLAEADFPQLNIIIDRLARRVARHALALTDIGDAARDILAVAGNFSREACSGGLAERPDAAVARSFLAWLRPLNATSLPTFGYEKTEFKGFVRRFVDPSMMESVLQDCIAYLACRPEWSKRLPPEYYGLVEYRYLATEAITVECPSMHLPGTRWCVPGDPVHVHQMLGHPPANQRAATVSDDRICLLRMDCDRRWDFRIGDLGGVTFWIDSQDLAAGRWHRAAAEVSNYLKEW